MKRLIVVALMLAVAIPAMAGDNPNAAVYLTFDSAGEVFRFDPTPFQPADLFLCMKNVENGFISTTLAIVEDAGVTTGIGWASLLPGGLTLGPWDVGVTITSSSCVAGEIVVVASGNAYYMGNPGQIVIIDHPDYPRWVVDCQDAIDYYCHMSNVGVLMDPVPTGEDCEVVAVEDATWGGIKALYR